jgi:hypothetical protein
MIPSAFLVGFGDKAVSMVVPRKMLSMCDQRTTGTSHRKSVLDLPWFDYRFCFLDQFFVVDLSHKNHLQDTDTKGTMAFSALFVLLLHNQIQSLFRSIRRSTYRIK